MKGPFACQHDTGGIANVDRTDQDSDRKHNHGSREDIGAIQKSEFLKLGKQIKM